MRFYSYGKFTGLRYFNRCGHRYSFDGDADRMLAVDENGKLIDGDQIMAACAKFMRDNGTLKQNTLVATVMSNLGLFMAGEKIGINIPRTKVGDRYVLEEMLAKGLQYRR